MTKQQYAEFEQAFADFMESEGLETFSPQPINEDDDDCEYGEPYFSWQSCECCGSPLGGNREDYIGWNPTTREIQGPYSICMDCVYYNEYGQLDDMTMLELEG